MDIIERLWIAHAELPGRQLLMRDAITEIQRSRDENENLAAAARIADRRNDELREGVKEAVLQIEYLSEKFGKTGTGEAVIARLRALLNTESEP